MAVVVPHKENTEKWAKQNGYTGSFSQLCSLKNLEEYVLHELKSTAERNKVIYEGRPYNRAYPLCCLISNLNFYESLQLLTLLVSKNQLRGFEYIKGVYLVPEPFDVEHDLVTPTLKKKRDKLLTCYKVHIIAFIIYVSYKF